MSTDGETMYRILKINTLLILWLIAGFQLKAQNSLLYTDEDYNYRMGIELFEKQKYAGAQEFFARVIEYYGTEHTDVKADAEYFSALCSMELFNADAEYRIANFIADYPESPRTRVAYFEMGRFQYRKKKYDQALVYFDKVWKQNLTRDQLNEFYFKKGYCYFKTDQLEKAAKAFYEILSNDSKYSGPANYYYSHIAYVDGNYETALNGFKKLEADPTFAPVVPYYVVQIYYLQGKTDKVLEYGPTLIDSTESKRDAEISRLIGEALYKNGRYAEALPYLEKYKAKAETYTREDIYELGYVYYMDGQYDKAVESFSTITNVDDGLTQNAYFHMADCYLKSGQKEKARMAFEASSKLDFNTDVKEISLLNYAKLSFELSYSPFNETIRAFNEYITTYPNSVHHDEAYGYLVKVYLNSKNYKEALESLTKIKVKTPEMLEAHQRVAYFRGLELFNNLQFSAALAAFELSLKERSFDKQMQSLAIYWKGEALYRLERYQDAADAYNQYLLTPGSYLSAEYNNSYYNLGYCYFKQKQYDKAISWFRKYSDKGAEVNEVKRCDALIRIADCYFVSRDYNGAEQYYNQAVKLDTFDMDYALFQKGFSLGLIKQYQEKIKTLTSLLETRKQSNYAADALFERARSYVLIDSTTNAINDFKRLLVEFPSSSYVKKTHLQLGLLYYGKADYENALSSYKHVVSDYPESSEAKEALLGIKNIYVDLNKVDDYFAYAKQNASIENISYAEKDSLTYLSAEKIYMTGNWSKSVGLFNNYLKNYSDGKFLVNAHYYRGDCFYRTNNLDSALTDFTGVVSKPKSIFTEQAILNAAKINESKGQNSKAFQLFLKLENQAEVKSNLLIARKGEMHTAFKDSNYNQAIDAARKVLITDKAPEEDIREARMVMGKSYLATNMLDAAITQFRILALDVKNAEGAESKYRVAQILYRQNDFDKAEQDIIEFIGLGTPHQYWLAKAFLLLSDIYLKKSDVFQAKANLQSLIDNYGTKDDGIINEATAKLDSIVTEENKQFNSGKDQQKIEIKPVDKSIQDSSEIQEFNEN